MNVLSIRFYQSAGMTSLLAGCAGPATKSE
jgi:hypothetical protein